ncbi:RluA family pseudouridine synthase [Leptolyngbya sp. FACHB-261]|nr:RluA family pseudouridine synthase [Leptolyngbya sp. FACHB-261]
MPESRSEPETGHLAQIQIPPVAPEDSGERLDRWLAEQLPDLSRSRIQKLIEQGQVRLNGQVCNKKDLVQVGDQVDLSLPEPEPLAIEPETMPLSILYEDDQLLVIDKPVGLVVHPAPGHSSGTLVNGLLAHCQDSLSGIGGVQRPGIVHRLDRDTTGVMVVAKTDAAHRSLQAQIQAKTARREYLGVIYGCPRTEAGSVSAPLGRHPVDRKKMAVVPEAEGGRQAVTHWRIQERLGNYTLLHFDLETGRTHQIRVHAAYMGHPIVGDPVYASGKTLGVNLPGQALHAWRLSFQHPTTREALSFEAPLPGPFLTLLQVLRQRSSF